MVSYHINPTTGNANQCRATKKCPFGDLEKDHYKTAEAARAAYEKQMDASLAGTHEGDKGERGTVGELQYQFDVGREGEAVRSIEKANRRLAKFGIVDRFEYTLEEKHRLKKHNGLELSEPYFELTLNAPTIGLEGHRFLAVISEEDAGFVTRSGAGVELHGWRPTTMACEHCGQKRPRAKTYLVEGPDGKRHQIGSSCVQAYLGVKPEGLWALGYDPIEKLPEDGNKPVGGGNPSAYSRPVKDTIAYALAVSNGGKNFTSKSAAMEYGRTSTVSEAEEAIFGMAKDREEWRREMSTTAQKYLEDGTADKVLEHIRSIEGMSDYAVNVRTLANGEWVKPRNAAILISGIASYRRTLDLEVQAKAPKPAEGFAGFIGEALKGRKVKIEKLDEYAGTNSYTGEDETRTRVTMLDEHNHQLVWWTSSKPPVEAGQTVALTGGRVKDHSNYKGTDQTLVKLLKFAPATDK